MGKKLILSSGGFKGIVFIGMLSETDLGQFSEIIGTSAGALITFMLAMGYSVTKIEELLLEKINNIKHIFKPKILTFTKTYGIVNQDNVIHFIKDLIPFDNKDISFRELYEKTNLKISFITSNIMKNRHEILNHENTPDMPVYLGVLSSMSIPLIFPPVSYKDNLYIDGGLYSPYYQDDIKEDDVVLYTVSKQNGIKGLYSYINSITTFVVETRAIKETKNFYKIVIDYEISLFDITEEDVNYLLETGKANKVVVK